MPESPLDELPPDLWLALVGDDEAAEALQACVMPGRLRVRQLAVSTGLVRCSSWHAPQAVVVHLTHPLPGLHAPVETSIPRDGLASVAWPAVWDVPVLALGHQGAAAADVLATQLADMGVHHWLAAGVPASSAQWQVAMAYALGVHRREQGLRQRIASLQNQLAEQRLVAKAKGLLMAAQGMTEDDAFSFLRSGAMQTRLPIGDMARAVVDAAVWSEAVNRAGQLRWLSQRCVAAAAQRLARIEPPVARKVQSDALKRARDILDDLARLPLPAAARAALADTDRNWLTLKAALGERLDLASLQLADTAADAALAQAEALTSHLQAVGSSPVLRVVNLCGRQRMRAQRLVKLGLLTRLSAAPPAQDHLAEAAALVAAFGSTLSELAALPLGSAEIAAAHHSTVGRWGDMLQALQTGEPPALVRCGEALLVSVDALTHCWERSLQLLLG